MIWETLEQQICIWIEGVSLFELVYTLTIVSSLLIWMWATNKFLGPQE